MCPALRSIQVKRRIGASLQVNRVGPQMRKFATSLMAYEARGTQSLDARAAAFFAVSEKLRPQLAMLTGTGGHRALLTRALALAKAEVVWLRAVRVSADGSLEGIEKPQARIQPNALFEGRVVLLARLLGLLVAFIGQDLTLRLVRDVWPEVPLDGLEFGTGDEDEKTE